MKKFRPTLRVIRGAPLSVRRVLALAVLIGVAIGGIWGAFEGAPSTTTRSTETAGGLFGTVSVIDGDTLDLHGQRIRLHGIDAPESRQNCTRQGESWRCGQQAALALADYIDRQMVRCDQRDVDRYKRIVAVCYLGATDINAWLVEQGWAMAYRQFSKDYVAAEQNARQRRVGIWQGEVQAPWDWRRQPKGKS